MKTLRDIYHFDRKVGGYKMGLELEVEGTIRCDPPANWNSKPDGSLGPNGVEFVTIQAFSYERAEELLTRLDKALKDSESEINCSGACSVHVHMNVQDLKIIDIVKILTMYYIFEDALTEFSGPDRVGNLFCLRASDSEEPIFRIIEDINEGTFPRMLNDDIRYAALNLRALSRFGTLEFRSFRGIEKSPLEVVPWVNLLTDIRQAALEYDTPAEIVEQFSILGTEEFIKRVFREENLKLLDLSDEFNLHAGVRRAQWLAYQIDYSKFEVDNQPRQEVPIRLDQFLRDIELEEIIDGDNPEF